MRSIEKIVQWTIGRVTAHPRIVLLAFLLCTCALGWQARHFRIDASADTLLMRDNPHYVRTQVVNRRFSPQEFLLIAYEPTRHSVFSEQTFADLRAMTDRLLRIERVEAVRSILNTPLFVLADGELSSQTDPDSLTIEAHDFDMSELSEAFRGHPIYENLLINESQSAAALQVLFKKDKTLDRLNERIVGLQEKTLTGELSKADRKELASLRKQIDPINQKLDVTRTHEVETIRGVCADYEGRARIHMGGIHVLAFQLIRIIKNDLLIFGSAIGVLICLILFLLFHKLKWVVIPVLCCICSVLSTMGIFSMFGLKTTVISSNFIALQLILTLAIVIHLIVQYREYSRDQPAWSQERLVRETLSRKIRPCFYAGITTSVGFGSLVFSGIQPVIVFGWMMIIAMFFSISVSLILFPAMMALSVRGHDENQFAFSPRMLSVSANVALRHPRMVAGTGVAIVVLSLLGMLRLDVENSFLNYFRASTRVRRELSFIDTQFGGSTPLDLVYTIGGAEKKEDLVLTADTVMTLQRIQHALEQHDAVGKIISIVNFTDLARVINDGRPLTEYELTALYWTMESSLRDNLLGAFFSADRGQVRFSARIQDGTKGLDRAELMSAIRQDMSALGIPEDRYMLTSLFVLYQDILQRLFRSQILTLGIVFAALALTFWGLFRSLKIALVGMIPNTIPTLVVLGVMGWLRIPLDLMTITIAAIAMGIAVDDTIHYIHRYLEEPADASAEEAVKRTHSTVGHAILYTSLIIILGFSLLSFSDFIPSVLFGLLTGLAMAVALAADLCLLPVLLRRFVTPRGSEGRHVGDR